MNFVKESVNQTPIVDTVFSIVAKAKEAKAKVGSENVVDAKLVLYMMKKELWLPWIVYIVH